VKGTQPGDMLSIRFLALAPLGWGANFNNPGELKTGALPDEFPEGQVKYLEIVTQVVDVNQGVHAMIPKEIFARDLRETIRVV
jgi:acetamidase/formamidase